MEEPSAAQFTITSNREGMLPSNTDYSYNTFRRKFAAFVGVEFDVKRTLPKHVYSDENISRFVAQEAVNCNYVVSILFSLFFLDEFIFSFFLAAYIEILSSFYPF
jgi:hypothetical protein